MSHRDEVPAVLANYWLTECLGAGYSGSIYRAEHLHTHQIVALKVQPVDHECPTNRYERGFYPYLQGGKGMPKLWAAGVEGHWDYMAIELLGKSLDSLYRASGKNIMDLRSVCCIAWQMIDRLEFMHSRGILHRDIQLGNTVVGLAPHDKTLYMIDFGFSKQYIDRVTGRHIEPERRKRDFIGNYWFSSISVHCNGKVPARRDDLEALGLMLIHLLTPNGLPWTRNGVPRTDQAHDRLIAEKKSATPEHLCKGLPFEFEDFLRYCRQLKFKAKPDYAKWKDTFKNLLMEEGYPSDTSFIWPPPVSVAPKPNRRSVAPLPDEVENILAGLKNINIGANSGDRPVLGDRKNIQNAINSQRQTIVITDSTDASGGGRDEARQVAVQKGQQLFRLKRQVQSAIDNEAIAAAVKEFVDLLNGKRSKVCTKEGFAFLDALCKQLGDPSVFLAPLRNSAQKGSDEAFGGAFGRSRKLDAVGRLKLRVRHAKNNSELGDLVTEFGKITDQSRNKNVTKDGLAFLDGLSQRLLELK